MKATTSAPQKIAIIGAGFSGLTLAALLSESGKYSITIYDKNPAGGLINSTSVGGTLFENAAPSVLNHHEFENFTTRLGVKLHRALPSARKRYLFLSEPTRWPLGFTATLKFLLKAVRFGILKNKNASLSGLTLEEWATQHFGREFTEKVLKTAVRGIYATPISELSAELVAGRFFAEPRKKNRAKQKGSVVPEGGLSNFLARLKTELQKQNVSFKAENPDARQLLEIKQTSLVVFATGFSDFIGLISASPESFLRLQQLNAAAWLNLSAKVKAISLAKVHLLLPEAKHSIDGFGMLFHPDAGFQSLGVIANSQAFSDYGPAYNESWILNCHDTNGLERKVLADRERLFGESETVSSVQVSFTKNVYPVYDKNLQNWLAATHLQKGFYATGNYWGALGLAQIFLQNQQLCESITNHAEK